MTTWTTDPPEVSGWYWAQWPDVDRPRPCYVRGVSREFVECFSPRALPLASAPPGTLWAPCLPPPMVA